MSLLSTFILAGMDTTSNALARILHLLALHPDVQDKLRAELVDAQEQYGDRVPYDELSSLPYMDAICRETMRLYVMFSVYCSWKPTDMTHQLLPDDDLYQRVSGTFATRTNN